MFYTKFGGFLQLYKREKPHDTLRRGREWVERQEADGYERSFNKLCAPAGQLSSRLTTSQPVPNPQGVSDASPALQATVNSESYLAPSLHFLHEKIS